MSLEMDQGEEIDQISIAYDKENSEFINAMRKKNILWRDKFIYTLGVINAIVTPYILAAFPNYFYYWYLNFYVPRLAKFSIISFCYSFWDLYCF